MTTKERIELEALDLFSTNGYAGVSIRDIASRVGIKESSIYKHYKGKEEIFNTIKEHYLEKTNSVFSGLSENPSAFADISGQFLINMMKTTFQAFASDAYISKCRKLFMISAPGNSEIGKIYALNFITNPIMFNTKIFLNVVASVGHTDMDAQVMAYQFYSPIFCILQEYDNEVLTMEDSLDRIEKITQKFMEVYVL